VLVAGVVALARVDTRPRVLAAWSFAVLGLLLTSLLAGVRVELATSGTEERIWLGVPLLLVQASAITAAVIAGTGVRERLGSQAFGWRQPVGAVVVIAALVSPLLGLVWWAVEGTDGVIDRRPVTAAPEYMTDAAESDPAQGVLVVRGSSAGGYDYQLMRQRGVRTGDDSVLPTAQEQQPLTELVGSLASAPTNETVDGLLAGGVQYIYAPRPVDQQLTGNLDSLSGTASASALAPGARAWKLTGTPELPDSEGGAWHPWLVALECLAIVVVAVFAAPSRRRAENV
jgi:hypothetical protein